MIKYCIACLLLSFAVINVSWSLAAPEYLSVPHWQDCVSNVTKGTANFACLPAKKPANCRHRTWKKLTHKHLLENCPS